MASGNPIYLSINDKPRAIVDAMDKLLQRHQDDKKRYDRTRLFPFLFFLAGIPFIVIDFLAGYQICLFSTIAIALWLVAIAAFIIRWRARRNPAFPLEYTGAREIIHTLRDDLSPKNNLIGLIDLTGAQQTSKLVRTGKGMHKETVKFYRDKWLHLKMKLYDGNIMRLAVIHRVKAHDGRWKRGSSGKTKWKAGKTEYEHELDVRLTANPEIYDVKMPNQHAFGKIGQYTISELTNDGGIINLTASTLTDKIPPEDMLGVLRFAYTLLERKGQA
jgi:hypothetical protein